MFATHYPATMRTARLALLGLSATVLMAAQTATAAAITFDDVTDGQVMSDGDTGSTPEVAVSYEGDFLGYVSPWYPEGDGAIGGAIYNTTATGVGTVTFTAEPGITVEVNSLVLRVGSGQPSSEGVLEYSLDTGANWTEVATNVAVGETGLVTFTGVEAEVVQIRWTDFRLGGAFGNEPQAESDTALDNINFTATGEITVIPEPASLAIMGLGGVLMMRRRRA
ncbi:MAG: PEP-CTERM sorting domain-containing protein [Phycisphaeraceae bacterium]